MAVADSSADLWVITVEVEDSHAEDCHLEAPPACPASLEGQATNPGNATLDAYQGIEYVGVAVDLTVLAPGLPREERTLRGRDLAVDNPFLPAVTETWNQTGLNHGLLGYGLRLTANGTTVAYPGVSVWEPERGFATQRLVLRYGNGHGIQYDRVGPFNTPKGNSTDNAWKDTTRVGCDLTPAEACSRFGEAASEHWYRATPDLRYGLEFHEVEAATDADLLRSATPDDTPPGPMPLPEEPRSTEASPPVHLAPSPGWSPEGVAATFPKPPPQEGHPAPPERAPPQRLPVSRPSSASVFTQGPPEPVPPRLDLGLLAATSLMVMWALSGLYTRFETAREAMRSEQRQRLLHLLSVRPGVAWMDAARALGISRNALGHHVSILQRTKSVVVVRVNRGRFLYLPSHPPSDRTAVWNVHTASHVQRRILLALQGAPEGLTRADLYARLSDVPSRTRRHALGRLLKEGVLQCDAPRGGGVSMARVSVSSASSIPRGFATMALERSNSTS
ncbi:MAG TPA: hypothetical protein VNZ52_07110 [Candidatus Thermoplasmatota archaeon]|nr:hypothetical protein [Candidatus Thermoplasmatota archaeon]